MSRQRLVQISLLFFCVASMAYGSLSQVVGQYEQALQDLLDVYEDIKPPKPIQFDQTDLVGATYQKILQPYVLKLQGYADIVFSKFTRKAQYYDDLQELAQKFASYEQDVVRLSKKFPTELQQDAITFFHQQLTTSVVKNCSNIVQQISFALVTKAEDIKAAQTAYNLAWTAHSSDLKDAGFASIDEFEKKMTSWMIDLYQAALKQRNEALQTQDDKQALYQQMSDYYKNMAQVYQNAGNDGQAQVEKNNAFNIRKKFEKYQKAEELYQQAESMADQGRSKIVINFSQPEDTKESVATSLSKLKEAQSLYQQAGNAYQLQLDFAGVSLCNAKQQEIQADQQIRGLQILWVLFLQNDYRSAVKSSVQAFDELKKVYGLDDVMTSQGLSDMQQALQQLQGLCNKVPNDYNDSLALLPVTAKAILLYQSATIGHSKTQSGDRLIDTTTVHDLQQAVTTLNQLLQGMVQLGEIKEDSVLMNHVAPAMVHAKLLDKLFDRNADLKNYMFYLPELEVSMSGKKSFESFVVQYLYQFCLAQAAEFLRQAEQLTKGSSEYDQKMLQALSYVMVLQNYQEQLSDTQIQMVAQQIDQILKNLALQTLATTMSQKAKLTKSWDNTAQGQAAYQSKSDTLFKRAMHLYEVMLQFSLYAKESKFDMPSAQELQQKYLELIDGYVSAYINNVTAYTGYQLYIAPYVYELYLGAQQLDQTALVSKARGYMQTLLVGTGGWLSQVKQQVDQVKAGGLQEKEQIALQQDLSQQVQAFHLAQQQQDSVLQTTFLLFKLKDKPTPLLFSKVDDGIDELQVNFAGQVSAVEVVTPQALKIKIATDKIDDLSSRARLAENKQNFIDASSVYRQLEQSYESLLKVVTDSKQEQTYKQQYFLAKTRATASQLAATVYSQEAQDFQALKGVPTQYFATKALIPDVNVTMLSSSVPESLQGFSSLKLVEQDPARADGQAMLKAFMIAKILDQKGIRFADCYLNYQLNKKTRLPKQTEQTLQAVEQEVNQYFVGFKNVKISVMVAGDLLTFSIQDMPLKAITPLYPTGAYAGVYFDGAATLFQPGTKLLTISGGSYVPGQDESAADLMWQDLAYAYASEAQVKLSEGQGQLQELVKQVVEQQTLDVANFSTTYNRAKQNIVRAQALLFATGASAHYYFEKAKENSKTDAVKKIFLDSYKSQIDEMKKLLIGNPYANSYSIVLSDINQAYVSWSAELNPQTDVNEIESHEQAIVELFVNAAQQCFKYGYRSAMFPTFEQFHYMGAARNFLAARKQYLAMKDTTKAAGLEVEAMRAYYFACVQNVDLYFSVQKNGLVYTPEQILGSGSTAAVKPTQASFAQLQQAHQDFNQGLNVNPGKTAAYNTVKKLLLDASMFLQYLAGQYQKLDPSSQPAGKKKFVAVNPKIISFLQSKGILDAADTSINYETSGMIQKLFNMSKDGYTTFVSEPAVLADWCTVLNMAVAYEYIDSYLGGLKMSATGQPTDFTQKWQTFFQAIQKETSSFQNPASAYVG